MKSKAPIVGYIAEKGWNLLKHFFLLFTIFFYNFI